MIGGDYQKPGVLTFADEVYQEIQKKKFIIKFSDLKNKEPKYLLRMYGRINIHQISLSLNKKVVNYYKKISENFRASQVYFPSLVGKESLVDTRDTFLRDRSAYSVEAFFPTDVQIIRIYSRYLSYEPFPYQSAKCFKIL